jgi:ABC-2 type transport system permease protein
MRWIGLTTLVRRECAVVLRFWSVTLAPTIIGTILYFTVFGEIVGGRIGFIAGVEYSRYVAPGLILLSVIPSSYAHTAGGLVGARMFGYIEELLVSPMPRWAIVAGYVSGGIVRGIMVALAVGITSLCFTRSQVHSVFLTLATPVLAAWGAGAFGAIIGTFARNFEQVTLVQIVVLAPLTFLGGVFAPLSMQPAWTRELSLANPVFHTASALRFGLTGVSEVSVTLAVSYAAACATALTFLSVLCWRGPVAERGRSNFRI